MINVTNFWEKNGKKIIIQPKGECLDIGIGTLEQAYFFLVPVEKF